MLVKNFGRLKRMRRIIFLQNNMPSQKKNSKKKVFQKKISFVNKKDHLKNKKEHIKGIVVDPIEMLLLHLHHLQFL